jgi:hypothetical protein
VIVIDDYKTKPEAERKIEKGDRGSCWRLESEKQSGTK